MANLAFMVKIRPHGAMPIIMELLKIECVFVA